MPLQLEASFNRRRAGAPSPTTVPRLRLRRAKKTAPAWGGLRPRGRSSRGDIPVEARQRGPRAVSSGPAIRAMKAATDVPVLSAISGDPVELGVVKSLAHPQGRHPSRYDAAAACKRNASPRPRARSSRPSVLLLAVIVFVETVRDILCDGWRFRLGNWLAVCSH